MKGKHIYKSFVILLCVAGSFTQIQRCFSLPEQGLYSEQNIKKRIIIQAINHGIDPSLALSLAKQESGFDRSAKSPVGAIGLFQLMPSTAKDLGVNPYYINQNIKGGIGYLKGLKDQFGKTELALAAYNAGPGAVSRYGGIPPYPETQHYVKNIMHSFKNYKITPDPVVTEVKEQTQDNLTDLTQDLNSTIQNYISQNKNKTNKEQSQLEKTNNKVPQALSLLSKLFSIFS